MTHETSSKASLSTRRYTNPQLCALNHTDAVSRKQDRTARETGGIPQGATSRGIKLAEVANELIREQNTHPATPAYAVR